MSDSESKIFVDDDWKSRVEAEKENLKKEQETKGSEGEEHQLPPASFPVLVSTLTSQALMALGHIPDPFTGQATENPQVARHFIDMLAMLQEKTKGNLDNEESAMLENVVHELRMAFVGGRQGQEKPAEGKKKGSIELP